MVSMKKKNREKSTIYSLKILLPFRDALSWNIRKGVQTSPGGLGKIR